MKTRLIGIMVLVGTLALFAGCSSSTAPATSVSGHTNASPTATTSSWDGGSGGTGSGASCQQVAMDVGGPSSGYFTPSTCTVPSGTMLIFVNRSEVVIRVYMGSNQQFHADPLGPLALNVPGGVAVYPGDGYGFSFLDAGTFHLTATCSTPMPNMNMTVTVTGS